jgi:hypothetical protein
MKTKNILSIALVLAVGFFALNALPMVALADNPVPTITTISPTTANVGTGALTLTVNGSNFVAGSTVNVNGSARPTTLVNSNQLTATLTPADVLASGNANITVTNPAPGGGTSGAATFAVSGNNPTPVLTSVSPMTVTAGNGAFVLTVNGSNFTPTSQIRFNGVARPTTFVSPTQLTATIPATDASVSGTYVVDVTSPTPGGGNSGSVILTVSPTTTTPGLPNTGFGPREENAAWIALAALGAIAGSAVITLVAKKATTK